MTTVTLSEQTARDVRPSLGGRAAAAAAVIALVVEVALLLDRMHASRGFYWLDDYQHLLIAKWVLHGHPGAVLDVWGRPAMTITYLGAAATGSLLAARITSCVLLLLTAALCSGIVRSRGGRWPLTGAVLLLAEPLTFQLGYSALPGTVFSFILATAMYLSAKQRHALAAVVASFLPAARLEGIVVLLIWSAFLVVQRRWRHIPLLAIGLLCWAAAGAAIHGDVLWLLHANPYGFFGSPYPRAGWLYGFGALARMGGMVAALAVCALPFWRTVDPLDLALMAGLSAFYCLVWGLPAEASLGDPVYFVSLSVPMALLAHHTITRLAESERANVLGSIGAVLFVVLAVHAFRYDHRIVAIDASVVLVVAYCHSRAVLPSALRQAAPLIAVAAAVATLVALATPLYGAATEHSASAVAAKLTAHQRHQLRLWTNPPAGWFAGGSGPSSVILAGAATLPPGSIVITDSGVPGQASQMTSLGYRQIAQASAQDGFGVITQFVWQKG